MGSERDSEEGGKVKPERHLRAINAASFQISRPKPGEDAAAFISRPPDDLVSRLAVVLMIEQINQLNDPEVDALTMDELAERIEALPPTIIDGEEYITISQGIAEIDELMLDPDVNAGIVMFEAGLILLDNNNLSEILTKTSIEVYEEMLSEQKIRNQK